MVICIQEDENHKTRARKNRFDDSDNSDEDGPIANEVDHYLNEKTENVRSQDLITWWRNKATVYPCLSRMALDYLSIPGMFITSMS
jgi:hypothetical protein